VASSTPFDHSTHAPHSRSTVVVAVEPTCSIVVVAVSVYFFIGQTDPHPHATHRGVGFTAPENSTPAPTAHRYITQLLPVYLRPS